eukprot:11061288-Alexandrium_andersonii.AAC.1
MMTRRTRTDRAPGCEMFICANSGCCVSEFPQDGAALPRRAQLDPAAEPSPSPQKINPPKKKDTASPKKKDTASPKKDTASPKKTPKKTPMKRPATSEMPESEQESEIGDPDNEPIAKKPAASEPESQKAKPKAKKGKSTTAASSDSTPDLSNCKFITMKYPTGAIALRISGGQQLFQ